MSECNEGDKEGCEYLTGSGSEEYVGWPALSNTEAETFCRCNSDSYGPNCNLNLTQFEDKYKDGCKNGIFEPKNTITGCSCREPREGNATEYHGWYCERSNE